MSYKEDVQKIRQSHDELNQIINNSWNAIGIINLDSQFVYVNTAFSPIFGYTDDELLEIKFEDLIVKKDKEAFEELVVLNYEKKYENYLTINCIRKDKKIITLKITISLMLNKQYFVINATDITQSVSDHQILDKYVIHVQLDLKSNITKVSQAFCRVTGYDEEELIGRSFLALKHPKEEKEKILNLWNTIQNGKEYTGTILNVKKNGDDFLTDIAVKPVNNRYGEIVGYTTIMFDLTNEMLLKEKVDESESKLKIMNDAISIIAHQWRQPLNFISLEAQGLLINYEFEENISDSDKIAIEKLKNIVSNVDELSDVIHKFQKTIELKDHSFTSIDNIIEQSSTMDLDTI